MALNPCPSSPNCVSSQAEPGDRAHYVEPIRLSGDAAQAVATAREVIESMGGVVGSSTDTNLEATFRTKLLRFTDDFQVEVDAVRAQVHVRSASRTGYSDLGVNRKRAEAFRRAFEARNA